MNIPKKYPWKRVHHSGYLSRPTPSSGICKLHTKRPKGSVEHTQEEVRLKERSFAVTEKVPMDGFFHIVKDSIGYNEQVKENCRRLAEAECAELSPSPLHHQTQKHLDSMKLRSLGLGKALKRW